MEITLEILYKKESIPDNNWVVVGRVVFFDKELTDKLKTGLASKDKQSQEYIRKLVLLYLPIEPDGETYLWKIKWLS